MLPAQPKILEQLDRLIGLFLRAPATAAAARIVLCLLPGFVLVAILGVVGARRSG